MSVTLPYDAAPWPAVVISFREEWGDAWEALPYVSQFEAGVELVRVQRNALPEPDRAVFIYRYGRLDQQQQLPPILPSRAFVKIEIDGVICFIGTIEATRDQRFPGSSITEGDREYHCDGALTMLRRWRLDRHQDYVAGTVCVLNPGYNIDGLADFANADPGSLGYQAHAYPGSQFAASFWTDAATVEHALAANDRAASDPDVTLAGNLSALTASREWPINEGESVADHILRVLDRRRGVGVSFFAYASGVPVLRVQAEQSQDIVFGSATITGSDTDASSVEVDLRDDYRLGPDARQRFEVAAHDDQLYDAVEGLGERIQVLTTLDRITARPSTSGLADRWTSAQQTAYEALTNQGEATPDTDPVFCQFGVQVDVATVIGGDGTTAGSTAGALDYRCTDAGAVIARPGADADTPPATCRIMEDIPLLGGWDYSGASPVRTGYDEAEQVRSPVRLFEIDGAEWYDIALDPVTVQVERVGRDLRLNVGGTARFAERYEDFAMLAAVELPHRLRLRQYRTGFTAINAERIKRLYFPGLELHVAHVGAVYGIDDTGAPLRFSGATQASPYVLRSDLEALRDAVARAASVYLRERKTASWQLRACGLNGGWLDGDNVTTLWPQLGQVVTLLAAGGQFEIIDTPITLVHYDHQEGITTWATGWSDRDWTR
jgi:hypothetical protein